MTLQLAVVEPVDRTGELAAGPPTRHTAASSPRGTTPWWATSPR